MAETAAPPATPKKRKQQLLLAGGALVVLFVLFMRSRSQAQAALGTAGPASLNPSIDPSTGIPYSQETAGAVQPSTFADNGAQAAALGDSVTQLTGDLETLITDQQAQLNAEKATAGLTAPGAGAAGASGASTLNVTVNTPGAVTAPPKPGNPAPPPKRPPVGSKAGHGAIVAPYGPNKPPPKPGFTTVGTGKGGWIYKPKPAKPAVRRTGATPHRSRR